MPRLGSLEELKSFKTLVTSESGESKPTLVVSAGTCGQASGSNDIIRVIKRHILEQQLHDKLLLRITGCLGFCEVEPFIIVEPGQHLYPNLNMEDVPEIIGASLKGEIVENYLYREAGSLKSYVHHDEIPFFNEQTRTILGSNQNVDPIRILDYIRMGGYSASEKALEKDDPEWIVNEVLKSGLRGRGGAGFPTGRKWQAARKSADGGGLKYLVCNADEGDPGAYMDRSLLEGNPHAIIDGMLIAGLAIGATKGIIYVRGEYPLAIKHSVIAIRQARDMGLLGNNILGSGHDFDIEIIRGAGAFVCGEETALIKSIEGQMGEPHQRPPYPITKGIYGYPTCINNVETLANIPIIIEKGAEEYSKVGIPGNTGTKIFSLVGKIKNTGLVEVPLGTPISKLVYDIGGGSPSSAKLKAVQTGGPSGGCIPVSEFDLSIDFDNLAKVGSIMGSGGMIVMDDNTCMVDVARYFMSFLKEESCGKCFTCRKGTQRMYEILDDITKGRGTLDQLDLLEELAHVVKDTTLCGLGQSASNPVLSTIKYFRHEYEKHILQKRCDAFVCKELVGAPCASACPVGTEAWRYVAHIERGEYEDAYKVIRAANPFPSVCARVCNHPCEIRCRANTSGGRPIAIRPLKRFITDRVDPSVYKPKRLRKASNKSHKVAIVGAGPAGLTAAHYLSLNGIKSTIFEAGPEPGGMLVNTIPEFRLPRDVIRKEIKGLLDKNITVNCNTNLGRDITIDRIFSEGYKAVFLAIGAHESRKLGIKGEKTGGVIPAIAFLKAFNMEGKSLAKGNVGIIGGGNSAIDAARMAVRQNEVKNVTIFYRRTRQEMPAFAEEIEEALKEGIRLETLISPVKVNSKKGRLTSMEFIRNELGDIDTSGRRRPVPVPGSEYKEPLDTVIVAISEAPDFASFSGSGRYTPDVTGWGTVSTDSETLSTSIPGVFAGGDLVSGPNTVIEAIMDGKKVANVITRFLNGEELKQPVFQRLPDVHIAPSELFADGPEIDDRIETPKAAVDWRKRNFAEVEVSMSVEEATNEARRCLRCDLEFTQQENECQTTEEKLA